MVALTAMVAVLFGQGARAASAATGGSMTVGEDANFYGSWPSLDPVTSTHSVGEVPFFDAIFGDLFEQGPKGQLVPDLATGYKFTNGGKTLVLHLRHGVRFSDGTPFNAAAVAFNFQRNMDPKNASAALTVTSAISSVTTPDNYTVDLHLSRPDAELPNSFLTYPINYIPSPTAFQKMGLKNFSLKPVGAGPFEVVSNDPSTKLVLKRNPLYWQKGLPHLNTLTFLALANDQSAYDALLTGEIQAYQPYSTLGTLAPIIKKGKVRVTAGPAAFGAQFILLNSDAPPFNNILAREAIYYATDPAPLNRAIQGGLATPSESPSIKNGLYYEAKVPGYRTYDLAKAKALVKQLGGLKFTIFGKQQTPQAETVAALKSEWVAAGMDVTIGSPLSSPALLSALRGGKWQADVEATGGFDPALGVGLPLYFVPSSPFAVVKDPKLVTMINAAAATLNASQRQKAYFGIWKYISDEAYAPFMFDLPFYNLSAKSVSIPGLTTYGYQALWQNATG
ncbi:MAG: ABC transporter substrate-binding protein [Acidimicrobiaceae bacterium]|nr:ABC transporter substrate-binding protein [Acidimicrobiaceae bacterium]